ncbi:MAG: TonB-dependent receptor [Lutibacter sp.]|uniref:TonB-dependent receptor n=1 Tax=Lutibacter sp. TaxID=1925666 RepID=UPI0017E6E2AD|nr:TonB-dependent receptor [Lutibacter sp.]MBT8316637.1 TonB-dependent receptor [Lutibacter sp.]NNJ57497.1 TonB-dependent receptor [Lutibacter sp.]
MKKIFIAICLLTNIFAFGQSTGTIEGTIFDKEVENEPLPFANVFIKGTTIGTTTEFEGTYTLKVEPGTYTVVFSFIGYQTIEVPNVIVNAGETITINKTLNASQGVSLDEIQISGSTKKESETALLTEQRKAVSIQQSIGSDELNRKGVSDAATAITKISGISKEGSSNVYVRGLGDRYLNTTFNQLSMPSNDINKKNIDLSLFSSDIIQNVSVSKAYAANFYGDFAAGNVNITSKEYTGDGFVDASITTGVNTNAAGKNFVKSDGTGFMGFYGRYEHNPFAVILSHGIDPINAQEPINTGISLSAGKSFDLGEEGKLSLFLTGSFGNNYTFLEGNETDYTNVEKKSFQNVEKYNYATNSTIMGSAIYRINNDHKITFNSLFINNSVDEVGYYGVKGLGTNRDAFLDTDQGFYQMNVQFNQDLVFVNQLIGSHKIDDKVEIDWGVGYNNVYSHEPDRKRVSLEQYHYALDNDPTTNASFYTNNSFDNQRYFEKIIDEEINGRFNLKYAISETIKLNVGLNGRSKERRFNNIRYGYKNIDDSLSIDANNFNAIFNYDNWVDGLYETDVFRALYPEGEGVFNIGPTNNPGKYENTYNGTLEDISGYTSAEITLGEKWLIVPGFRAEYFSQKINYNVINLLNNPGISEVTEQLYLPTLNIKYSLTDDVNFRASFSNTASFPEFKEMAPYVYEGVTSRIGGNPDLLGHQASVNYTNVKDVSYSKILNLDFKVEWFISRGEIISIAGFAKEIKDPINLVVANDATGTQRFFRTGNKAKVYGAEIEMKKDLFTYNDEPLIGAGFNVSYMHTEQDLFSTIQGTYSTAFNRETEELQGASPLLVNADVNVTPNFGEKVKPTINLIANYFSDRIFALGSGQLGNKIEKGFATLDFVWKNKIGENTEINFSAQNILNPRVDIIREITNNQQIILESYKRGLNLSLQFKYKF